MLNLAQIESFYPENLRPFKRNLLREYFQYKILEVVFGSTFGTKLAFMGGTAIHIVHGLPRFSEDLDFDNLGLRRKDFEEMSRLVVRKLCLEGYDTQGKCSFEGAFRSDIKILNILHDTGLSGHKEEKILIYLDAEPQHFQYRCEKPIINRFDILARIQSVPVDVLLAQKILAIFMRRRPMGRDFYDCLFLWGKAHPNFDYLSAKIGIKNPAELKNKLLERSRSLDFRELAKDVSAFLFDPQDAKKIELFTELIETTLS